MSRRSYSRSDNQDDDYKYRVNNKRSDRSRSPVSSHSSYGITNESYKNKKQSYSNGYSQSSSSKSNGFVPDEETKKFYDKPSSNDNGFWTSEDYTFRDMLAKDVRDEIEDDIASKDSDDESEEDPELAEYADRADLDDDNDDEQKKTMVERIIPFKKDDEKKKDIKLNQTITNQKTSSSSSRQ
ncbi:unnamed protein product [Rotaria sordida]|uniref:Uncharacterized protein n=1 Tax=Rotaria sordida TaxID=392033 RepID=A0A813ZF39_9BILA|nr:unnamed protein product [Rotaria sordida]CAF0898503.1 unnamed protein product [Rotaria sordida]CAF3549729.1 unnamed protein product [Rotaria sordida]